MNRYRVTWEVEVTAFDEGHAVEQAKMMLGLMGDRPSVELVSDSSEDDEDEAP